MDAYVAAERRGPDSLRRFLLDLDAKEANQAEESRSLGEVLGSTLRSTRTRATRVGLRRRPMSATSGRSAVICWTGRDAALRAVRWRRPATRWRSLLSLWRASMGRRRRGRGVRTCCSRVCPSRRGSGVERALGRFELGRLVLSRARDPDQRVWPGQRAARQPAPLDASRGHRLRPRATPPRAGGSELGALTTGRGGDPCPDAPAGQCSARDPHATRRNGRESAVRARRAKPGGMGAALVIAGRRVRVGDGGAL